jgi:hypothetical protein
LKTYLAKLNPSERRLVVGVTLGLFIVLNIFLVWPHYADLQTWGDRRAAAEKQFSIRDSKIKEAKSIESALRGLEGSGANVLPEEQSAQFLRTIQTQAAQSGVAVISNGRQNTRTNDQFFIELEQSISVQSGEEQLVNFLYSLGQENSMIRVKSLNIRPDAPKQQLIAQATLIASYQQSQKRPAAAPASTAPRPNTPAAATPKSGPASKTNSAKGALSPVKQPSPSGANVPRPGQTKKQ